MTVLRWVLQDPTDPDPTHRYTVAINPNTMTSPFPEKAITTATTVSPRGRQMFFQGATPAKDWSFGGTILSDSHYEQLRHWVYEVNRKVWLFDHFGRRLTVVLRSLDVQPKRSVNHYWLHEYTINCYVIEVGPPTVGNLGPQ